MNNKSHIRAFHIAEQFREYIQGANQDRGAGSIQGVGRRTLGHFQGSSAIFKRLTAPFLPKRLHEFIGVLAIWAV